MICFIARRSSTAFIDGTLRPGERARVEAHLRQCDECSAHFENITLVRSGLSRLTPPAAPANLRTMLRVVSSRERSYQAVPRWQLFWERWKFRAHEFMRPITLPATGGLLSSLALFAVLAGSIGQSVQSLPYEVPYEDRPGAVLLQVDMRNAVELTMSLDENGRIRDYAVSDHLRSYAGDPARAAAANIPMPQFPGVLELAQPITGAVRISLTPILFRP